MDIVDYRYAAVMSYKLAAELRKLADAAHENGVAAERKADDLVRRPMALRSG